MLVTQNNMLPIISANTDYKVQKRWREYSYRELAEVGILPNYHGGSYLRAK